MRKHFGFLALCFVSFWPMIQTCAGGETNRFVGVSTNQVVAFYDHEIPFECQELAQSLNIHHWNFQVQVPDGTIDLKVRILKFDGKTNNELAHMTLNALKRDRDTASVIRGVKQFRVLLTLMPAEIAAKNPWFESRKLRFYAKEFQSGTSTHGVVDNPFVASKNGLIIHHSATAVRDLPPLPGIWDGYASRFRLEEAGTNCSLQIQFEQGMKYVDSASTKSQ
jgi:hypothetical protein